MKQVFFTASGQILVEDIPPPSISPGRVLVEVTHSLVSTGTEVASSGGSGGADSIFMKVLKDPSLLTKALDYARLHGVKATVELATGTGPTAAYPLGYSAAGRVAAVADDVTTFAPGDAVAIAGAGYASHAEYDVVPANLVVKLPGGVDPRQASFATVGAIGLQGIRRAQPTIGETVLVMGLGLIGQLTCQMLMAAGCDVIGYDLRQDRVDRALASGVKAAFSADSLKSMVEHVMDVTGGIGADAVILCASTKSIEPINQAALASRKKGRVIIVGDVGMDISRANLYRKELDVLISCSYGPGRYDPDYEEKGHDYPLGYVRWTENRNMQAFLELVGKGLVRPEELITIEEPVDKAPDVYKRLASPDEGGLAAVFAYAAASRETTTGAPTTAVHVGAKSAKANKIGVAVIGAGGYARAFHLPNFEKHPDTSLVGVVTRQGIQAKRLAESHGARVAATDYRDVLGEDDLNMVVIGTRHGSHVEISVAAAQAKKHVFVEKPVAMSFDGLAQVAKAIAENGMHLTVGHNRRYSDHARALKAMRDKIAGPVQMTYTVNAGALPRGHWVLDPDDGGGRIVGEVCHFFDLLAYLAGSAPVAVSAMGIKEAGVAPRFWQSTTHAVVFADGSVGRVDYAAQGSTAYPKERVELFAGGAVGVIDDFKQTSFFGTDQPPVQTRVQDKGQKVQVDDWINFLTGKEAAPILDNEALLGTLVSLCAIQSLEEGKTVEVDIESFARNAVAHG
ncbi:bi-domain-containing oxidoreductase [bacterium]|nr:bi-domain-containing oxidoreductase [bacterium]